MDVVNPLYGTSLHHQISTLIKDGISTGRYRPGDRLPTEEMLCRTHDVSRVTVRRALQSLEEQGLIHRRPRLGTFIAPTASVLSMPTPIASYLARVAERRALSRSRVIEFGFVTAPHEVGMSLDLEEGAQALRVVRLRTMGSLALVHSTVFLPEAIGRHFRRADFNRHALSELLAREGHHYGRIEMVTRARLASSAVAQLLQVEVASALVDVQRIAYDRDGRAIEFQLLQGPSDRFETHVTIGA